MAELLSGVREGQGNDCRAASSNINNNGGKNRLYRVLWCVVEDVVRSLLTHD